MTVYDICPFCGRIGGEWTWTWEQDAELPRTGSCAFCDDCRGDELAARHIGIDPGKSGGVAWLQGGGHHDVRR